MPAALRSQVEEFMSFLEKHASKPFVAPKVAETPVRRLTRP
jgi:hypothetical protein